MRFCCQMEGKAFFYSIRVNLHNQWFLKTFFVLFVPLW